MTKKQRVILISVLFISIVYLSANALYASQSTITESEGYACMGDDKSRKQTEQAAVADAKRKAVEQVVTYIKSETQVKNFELEKDIVEAYTRATVKVIETKNSSWYRDVQLGDCYKVALKAEVIPDEKAMKELTKDAAVDNPSLPLKVNLWTDKKEYQQGEKIRVYIKGNKPFYACVLYKDVKGEMIQLLPNPYKTDNYFNGGVVYEIPSGNDRFDLEVSPPFGEENVIVYASTSPLGDLSLKPDWGVYQVSTKAKDIGDKTRGVKIKEKVSGGSAASEFYEGRLSLKTGDR